MDLGYGDRGDTVSMLQQHLRTLGLYRGEPDGIFGRRTLEALAEFQHGHMVTGRLDDETANALNAAIASNVSTKRHELPPPHGPRALRHTFGEIEFRSMPSGWIEILNGWDDLHIVTVVLPIAGKAQVHRRMQPIFEAVFSELDREGLDTEIMQSGFWAPRHKHHRVQSELSTHAYGIAVDLNWARNPVGAIGAMHPEIVAVFEQHGFRWGGRFAGVRDDMHFQYCTGY